MVFSVTGSLYNCYVYFLVSILRVAKALKNCYIIFCKLLIFIEYKDWIHNMVFFVDSTTLKKPQVYYHNLML
jgi:hypothetical protein